MNSAAAMHDAIRAFLESLATGRLAQLGLSGGEMLDMDDLLKSPEVHAMSDAADGYIRSAG